MDALFDKLLDRVSKRQIVAIAAMWLIQQTTNLYQLVTITVIAVATIVAFTALEIKHGPILNGKTRPKIDPSKLPELETNDG